MRYAAGRCAEKDDFKVMLHLPAHPGKDTVGPRSLAFCHPNHSEKVLEIYFSAFPQGIFVSEEDGQIISFACAIRTSERLIKVPIAWSEATCESRRLAHDPEGDWLYVGRLAYTAGPGHAHVSVEIGPLLVALQEMAVALNLKGVAFPAPFPGFRERSGTSKFQCSTIEESYSPVRSGLHPIGIAVDAGYQHEIALPNYLDNGKHFALMAWRNEQFFPRQ